VPNHAFICLVTYGYITLEDVKKSEDADFQHISQSHEKPSILTQRKVGGKNTPSQGLIFGFILTN
jgi:hypothetical protein